MALSAHAPRLQLSQAARQYEAIARERVFGHETQEAHRLAPLWRATIAERMGQREQAVREREAFLAAWREADPGLVVVADARQRLQRLRVGFGEK